MPGTRLGVYEVVAPLGAGGMGEVYRGRDTKLGRDVAIKILPETFVGDADRVARFEREAQLLAALNHPHIAAIYGLDASGESQFLILELVEGETLAQRLKSGPLAMDDALRIARQTADALQAAHEKGIIHRDLKPANIALTHDGHVKVLDFGLAKALDGDASGSPGASPTLTFAATQAGVILGTAAYMSPEQAKGRAADKRGDVWAFGCVLFEMLAGKRAFEGEDISDTLAAVLRADPDWTALPASVPPAIRSLVERCLKKDRQQRIADIAVAQFLLSEPTNTIGTTAAIATASAASTGTRGWKIAAAVFGVTTAAALTAATTLYLSAPAKSVTRFLVTPPDKATFVTAGRTGTSVAISPDGRRLAFTVRDDAGKILIWLRPIDSLAAQPLAGTDNAEFPFWSPDSRSIAYFANDKLIRIDAAGGPPQTICDAAGARGGAWNREGVIVFGGGSGNGLSRVSAGGGPPAVVTTAEVGDHRFPSFLPDGHHLLFHSNVVGALDKIGLYVTSLDAPQPKRLADAESSAVYAAGYLLYARQTTLIARPFDLKTLAFTGDPTPVAEHLESGVFGGVLAFSVSDGGVLAYGIGSGRAQNQQLMVFDRQGKVIHTIGAPANYVGIDLSPDEKQIVAHRHDQATGGDLWLIDVARGTTSRFTFDAAQDNSSPVWSPDGTRIAYASLRGGRWGLFVKPSNGTGAEEPLAQPAAFSAPRSWSKDGRFLVYAVFDPTTFTFADVGLLPFAGDRKPLPLLHTRFSERSPQISPDGRWLAYSSDESGALEIYVRPFPSGDGKWQVSTAGGSEVRWRGDSRELFYTERPQLGSLMAIDIAAGPTFSAGTPKKLFDLNALTVNHPGVVGASRLAVSSDGQRFFIPTNSRATTFSDATSSPIAVVLNWADALRK